MTTNNENPKPTDNMALLKEQASACGAECGCHAAEKSGGKARWMVGAIVLVAAGVLVARAMVKNNAATTAPVTAGFGIATETAQPPASGGVATVTAPVAVKELGALAELNTVAMEMAGVFVFLPGKNDPTAQVPAAQIRAAAQTIEPKIQGQIGIFTLKTGSPDYIQLAGQMTVPGVLAMVKGRGMTPVSGEITEAKLVQAFVAASSAGGCGGGGCGPSGCK